MRGTLEGAGGSAGLQSLYHAPVQTLVVLLGVANHGHDNQRDYDKSGDDVLPHEWRVEIVDDVAGHAAAASTRCTTDVAHAESLADLEHAHAVRVRGADTRLNGGLDWTAAEPGAALPCPRKTGIHPFNF